MKHRPDLPGLVAAQTALGVKLLEEQRELKRQLEEVTRQRNAANASALKWIDEHATLYIRSRRRIDDLEEQLREAQGLLRELIEARRQTGETNGSEEADRPSEEGGRP
jgi:hypothetical protein